MSIVAVVPCRYENTEDTECLTAQLQEFCDEVLITTRPGLGPAYLEAWESVDPAAHVIHVDVGSHNRVSWLSVIDQAKNADVVCGTRFALGGEHVGNWKRKQSSRLASAACRTATMRRYTDWTNGLRSYSPAARATLRQYEFTTTGHAWQIEALWVSIRAGLSITEVPIRYQAGTSSLNRKKMLEAGKLWCRMVWS